MAALNALHRVEYDRNTFYYHKGTFTFLPLLNQNFHYLGGMIDFFLQDPSYTTSKREEYAAEQLII